MTSDPTLSPSEQLALLMVSQLREGDTVFVGANQRFVQRAVGLAALAGKRIRLVAAGGWWLADPSMADGLPTYSAEAIAGYDAPMHQEQAFEDLSRIPFVFVGGLQVDMFGNANLVGVGRSDGRWKLRGPGSAGLPTLSGLSSTYYAYSLSHDHRSLVREVEWISAIGDPRRRERLGLAPIERGAVFTPLGRFEWEDGTLQLVELGVGATVEQVRERTGFPVRVSDALTSRPAPTAAELAVLRR